MKFIYEAERESDWSLFKKHIASPNRINISNASHPLRNYYVLRVWTKILSSPLRLTPLLQRDRDGLQIPTQENHS